MREAINVKLEQLSLNRGGAPKRNLSATQCWDPSTGGLGPIHSSIHVAQASHMVTTLKVHDSTQD